MKFPEEYRWKNAPNGYGTQPADRFGAFLIPGRAANGRMLRVIASDGEETGWEHVSVSLTDSVKCPSWMEMCIVKDLFWNPEEAVMQLHPPKSEYVNNHEGCLHLWRPVPQMICEIPLPPSILVGLKESEVASC
ncbi:MAG: hypothetical protein ACJ74Y_10745 [Bryobacteraceae bacterium]